MSNEKNKVFKNLDKKTKFWYIFLSIITFGIFYLYVRNKIKQSKYESFNNKKESSNNKIKLNFDLNDLIKYLGGLENIQSVDNSLSAIKVEVKNKKEIKSNEIKKLGAKGVMISGNKASIVFGDQSTHIAQLIKDEIKEVA